MLENIPQDALPNRREVLVKGAKGAAGTLALLTLGQNGTALASNMLVPPTPGVTEGPYWVDELLNRVDVRSDPATGVYQTGMPLHLTFAVSSLNTKGVGKPLKNAIVDIWSCNALGVYSDEAIENTSGEQFLRGTQVTNAGGNVSFVTIYPGWYSGRTPHVHVRIRILDAAGTAVSYNFVTQMFFNETLTSTIYKTASPYNTRGTRDTTNSTDGIFTGASEDDEVTTAVGNHLLLTLSKNKKYVTGSFHFYINLNDSGYNNGLGGATDPSNPGGGGPPPGGGTPPGGTPPTP